MTARSLFGRIGLVAWSAILAFLILAFGQGVWGALLFASLRGGPAIPYAVAAMSVILPLMCAYLNGQGWPQRTSETRRRYLRANRVSGQAWTWAMLAGVLSIVALAGCWIVLFQLVQMPANALPDLSNYSKLDVVLAVVMGSLVSSVTEESAFRGYCQTILEREFRGGIAVIISSVLFMLAHVTQGVLWPKLLVYFLAGATFGAMAYLTGSILPGLTVHLIGDLTFFALIWPQDAQRQLVWKSGADRWFWLHALQAIVFTVLAVVAFRRLASLSHRGRAVDDKRLVQGPTSAPPA